MVQIGGDDFEDGGTSHTTSGTQSQATPRRQTRTRGPSIGDYGEIPKHPREILITPTGIQDSKAKATMLALMRARWPVGVHTFLKLTKQHVKWVERAVKEYRTYYKHKSDITTQQEDEGIVSYMKKNSSKICSEMHDTVKAQVQEKGGRYEDYCPSYISTDVWNSFCEYWRSEPYLRKSNSSKLNRRCLEVNHSSGAKSFECRREEYKEKNGVDPTNFNLFLGTHTKKRTEDKGTTAAVDIIKRWYIEIVQETPIDFTQDPSAELDVWVQATGPPGKNRIIGHPGESSLDLLGTRRRSSRMAKTASVPAAQAQSGTGVRPSSELLNSEQFMSAVDSCVLALKTQPELFDMTLEQVVDIAYTFTGRDITSSTQPLSDDVRSDFVRVFVTMLDDLRAHRPISQPTGSRAEETSSRSRAQSPERTPSP